MSWIPQLSSFLLAKEHINGYWTLLVTACWKTSILSSRPTDRPTLHSSTSHPSGSTQFSGSWTGSYLAPWWHWSNGKRAAKWSVDSLIEFLVIPRAVSSACLGPQLQASPAPGSSWQWLLTLLAQQRSSGAASGFRGWPWLHINTLRSSWPCKRSTPSCHGRF